MTEHPFTEEEKSEMAGRLHELEVEHHDLDTVIIKLAGDITLDQLQLQRLKKRKLFLKDQIAKLRTRLIPDLLA